MLSPETFKAENVECQCFKCNMGKKGIFKYSIQYAFWI